MSLIKFAPDYQENVRALQTLLSKYKSWNGVLNVDTGQ